jgi:protein-L-isoaspartate(D-aspartate) O-methyltransferase
MQQPADEFAIARRGMVENQIRGRGVVSHRVLDAMRTVHRHEFVPEQFRADAYADNPLPIGEGQTISQPFMVGAMTEALALTGSERVLEIGTGSGYQAAVLALLAGEVITIENHESLAYAAQERLSRFGYANVNVHTGDGSLGFAADAPYDAVLITAAAPQIPPFVRSQLREGGHLVIPVGSQETQELVHARMEDGHLRSRVLFDCQFVPLLGRYGWNDPYRKIS